MTLLLPCPPACGASSLPSAHSESQGAMCQPILGGVELWTDSRWPPRGAPSPGLSVAGSWHLIPGAPRGGLWARVLFPPSARCPAALPPPAGCPSGLPCPPPRARARPSSGLLGVSARVSPRSSITSIRSSGLPVPLSAVRGPCRGSSTAGGQGCVYQRGGKRLLEEFRGS